MASPLRIRIRSTGEERFIYDTEPLESAARFKALSDAIWKQNQTGLQLVEFGIPAEMPAQAARDTLNEVLGDIDSDLVISGIGKALKLAGDARHPGVELSAALLASPTDAFISTTNDDADYTFRRMAFDDQDENPEIWDFIDGHRDYRRELSAGLYFNDDEGNFTNLRYAIERYEPFKSELTELTVRIGDGRFADVNYAGHELHRVQLTVPHELAVLNAMQLIGGVSLETV